MSLNHWKLINHLKVYLSKHSQEKGVLDFANKEWLSIFEKLPLFYSRAVTDGEVDGPSCQRQQQGDAAVEPKPTRVPPVGLAPAKDDHSHGLLDVSKSKTVKPAEEKIPDSPQSKWLPKQSVSKESIYSRTKHVVTSVMTARSEQSRLKRLEELTNHLLQYPEAKSLAVREGVVRMLLHIRRQNADPDTLAVVREACTLLGHVDPLPGRGIRILSIDGGGIRGVIVIELLKKLERLTGKRVYEMFDFICGVSTGAILLSVLVLQKKSLEEMSQLYKELSIKVFTQNAIWGTSNLMWSHSYYNTEMWESMLRQNIGDVALIKTARDPQCPKLSFVSAVVNQAQLSAFVFRNYSFPPKSRSRYAGSCKYEVWQAVRASAAAPSYFEEFQLDGFLHQHTVSGRWYPGEQPLWRGTPRGYPPVARQPNPVRGVHRHGASAVSAHTVRQALRGDVVLEDQVHENS
ncbi:calcium-independent phospholipase A2-gamma-like isoform X2 [Bacillus rossius redtenbacheri]|uniref:calcium-independent phospholipase A2-gamma-like isoform X2 n=1 Tax=Bacillus rossius redtenbacheri TaxID=93214 RepID=UPI002FDE2B97